MEARRSRAALVPNANSPRLLMRLIALIAAGQRRAAPLADLLEVELRTVHYYTQAGEWLGLVETEGELRLTPRGLALAFAEPQEQRRLYAEALLSQPLARALVEGRAVAPPPDEVVPLILAQEPGMSPVTARRRASALRGLVEPLFDLPPPRPAAGRQLGLPFGQAPARRDPPRLSPGQDSGESPDLYRRVLLALLDNGELSTAQLRGVLDEVGARDAPLPPCLEMISRRGDAVRLDDRLIVTRGAVLRREAAEDAILVALTDPLYREYLGLLQGPGTGSGTSSGAAELAARNRLSRLASRFARWDLRVFGRRLQPGEVEAATAGLLPGRRLRSLPVAGEPGAPILADGRPYIEAFFTDEGELAAPTIAFPASLEGLGVGVAGLNPRLLAERAAPAAARLPGPLDPRSRVHGGLFAPGEAPPRAVPDNLSLRLMALSATPAVCLSAALLLAGRRTTSGPRVQAAGPDDPPVVRHGEREPVRLLDLLEAFARAQGQLVVRPPAGGLRDAALGRLLVALGVATLAGSRLVLDEALFARLQEDPECRLVYEALLPIEDRMMAFFDAGRG